MGQLNSTSNCFYRLQAIMSLGFEISTLNVRNFFKPGLEEKLQFHLGIGPGINKLNAALVSLALDNQPDILWIDKGIYIKPKSLKFIKSNIRCIIVHLNPDDPFGMYGKGWRNFINSIPYYDIHFVSRPQNIGEYLSLKAKKVYTYDRSFHPDVHRPMILNKEEKKKYGVNVGFIGTYARYRADAINFLLRKGVNVYFYGNEWHKYKNWSVIKKFHKGPNLYQEEYAKAISGMDIALHFLRRENRDSQDSRTFEIPACGTFMLAERSSKHEEFFIDGKEAVFFDTNEDLLEKIYYYKTNQKEREIIAYNGYLKALNSGYDHKSRLSEMLEIVKINMINSKSKILNSNF